MLKSLFFLNLSADKGRHKSYLPDFPHLQVGRYIFNILEQQYKQKEALPVIIPIIVYHGKRKWKYKSLSEYYKNIPPFALSFLPNFEIIVTDLSDYSDAFLLRLLSDKLLLNVLLALKHSRERNYVLNNLSTILQGRVSKEVNTEIDLERNIIRITFVYLSSVLQISVEQLRALLHHLPKEFEHMGMTLIEQLETRNANELIDIELELLEKHNRWKQEESRRKQEESRRKQEESRRKQIELRTVLQLYKDYNFSTEAIAKIIDSSIEYVEEMVKKYK